ncbi:neutrophil collagenase-like [Cataglyphis hispanica]|uniref:neutrophil collagenase-like n=1 Tax=Cataglyphis hispanica TaxID=1086592 RepID=UPI0021800165|nr:neutrophil collagenase-like [Cataglyphis hispanica]
MTTKTALLFLAATLVAATSTTPVDLERTEAFRFLRAYGFLRDGGRSLSSDNATSLRRALSLFQKYYQPGNGALNADTLNLMRKPRCGLADIPDRAYSPFAKKWAKTRLTWNFQVASEELLRTTEAAFALWAASSSLRFARDSLRPDILVSYRTGAHTYANVENGDVCPAAFEGPGGGLAHAFLPTGAVDFASEVHVDDEEPWHVLLNKNPSDKYHLLLTLTHEIGHTLGLQHSMRNDSVMFPYIPDNELQYPVKLSVEDILAVQNLYGSHDDGDRPAIPATTAAPATTVAPTTGVAPTDPSREDLCALRRLDAALIMNRRLYVSNRRNVWSIDLTEKRYGRSMTLTEYATFLPNNFTRLSAAYQRPSGDLALFANDAIYLAEYPSFRLKPNWPRSLHSIGFPRNAKINVAINMHSGRTYAIYDDDKVAEIDECRMLVVKHAPLKDIFLGIPSAITSAFRYIDGNLYFFAKRQFYAFNEFKNIVTSAGSFDLRVLGIECPTDGLLRQLRDLLSRDYRLDDSTENADEDDESDFP